MTPSGRARGEQGFTVVEMSIAVALCALLAATLMGILAGLGRNAGDAGRNADLQQAGRLIVAEMVMDLRQAQPAAENGYPVESLSADRVVFYSDRASYPGPERIVYERAACSGGLCELRVTRYAAVAGSGPNWTFQTTPFENQVLLERVLNDQPLFRGASWSGSPSVKAYVSSCTSACSFSLVAIRLRAVPDRTSPGAAGAFEITDEVGFRNEE